jgi:hypothetical protein
MNENMLKFSVDAERLGKLGSNFLQSKEGQDALASGSLKGHDRLFMSLASSSILNTTLFIPGKKSLKLASNLMMLTLYSAAKFKLRRRTNLTN